MHGSTEGSSRGFSAINKVFTMEEESRVKIISAVLPLIEERFEDCFGAMHRVFRAINEQGWKLRCKYTTFEMDFHGELKLQIFSRSFYREKWEKEKKVVWLEGEEYLSNLIHVSAELQTEVRRHNPMQLKILLDWQKCIASVELIDYHDCLHLEDEEDFSEIKEIAMERFKRWKNKIL